MLYPAARDVNHAVSAELEEPIFGEPSRPRIARPRPQPEAAFRPRPPPPRAAVCPREFIERALGGAGDPPLANRGQAEQAAGADRGATLELHGTGARRELNAGVPLARARARALNWLSTFLSQFSAILPPCLDRRLAGLRARACLTPFSASRQAPARASRSSQRGKHLRGSLLRSRGPVARCRSTGDRFGAITTAHFAAIRSRSRSANEGR